MTERADIEMALVRELSTGGLILSGNLTQVDKGERIRIAIMERKLGDRLFDASMTYAQAYERVFRRRIEQRAKPRDKHQRPIGGVAASATDWQKLGATDDPGDDDDGDEEEEP